MDGESEGLSRQLARLELTIKAEMEKCKVLQVSRTVPASAQPVRQGIVVSIAMSSRGYATT